MRNSPSAAPAPLMLSATADYALRALLVLAREPEGARVAADDVADAIGAPRNYLAKTLNALAKAGLLSSTRGPLGGFALAIPAAQLTVAQIVDAFQERRSRPQCLLGRRLCDPTQPCAAHHRWTSATRRAREALELTSVASLIDGDTAPHTAPPTATTTSSAHEG